LKYEDQVEVPHRCNYIENLEIILFKFLDENNNENNTGEKNSENQQQAAACLALSGSDLLIYEKLIYENF
jgi:hypothetical protein